MLYSCAELLASVAHSQLYAGHKKSHCQACILIAKFDSQHCVITILSMNKSHAGSLVLLAVFLAIFELSTHNYDTSYAGILQLISNSCRLRLT